jgi:hypothetical protein
LNTPTWNELIKLEPLLAGLLEHAKRVKDDPTRTSFCANDVWYGVLKPELVSLVGWASPNPSGHVLASSKAYSVAYQKIYDALPPCRNCLCL